MNAPPRSILTSLAAASTAKARPTDCAAVIDAAATAIIERIEAVWPALDAIDTGEDEAGYERLYADRDELLDAAERLPATTRTAVLAKALAFAWIGFVDLWERGRARAEYARDGRLALDVHEGMMRAGGAS